MLSNNISVIIPVKNGEATLSKCLASVSNQTIKDRIEIIILDSASTDNSKNIAKSFGAKIIDVDPGTFNHGLTRNTGVQYAQGTFLYFTVQDAWLSTNNTLEEMLLHFEDTLVQGVVIHQAVPHESDKNPAKWFVRYTKPEVETRYFPEGAFALLPARRQFELSNWDDVCAMYRKTALLKIPFRQTNFSEDWLWANDALHAGMKLIRDPSLIVYHSHHMSFGYVLKNTFIVNYYNFIYFNQVPVVKLSPVNTLRRIYTVLTQKNIPVIKKPYWVVHNIKADFASFISVFIFRGSLTVGGEKLLDKAYRYICKQVPQGQQKKQ
jgi:glycosyltransferase involved in cell wall biosynthesis